MAKLADKDVIERTNLLLQLSKRTDQYHGEVQCTKFFMYEAFLVLEQILAIKRKEVLVLNPFDK